jgi:hypothetical protein
LKGEELMRNLSARVRIACAVLALAAIFVTSPTAAPALPHLRGIDEVRAWFNAGKGHVRLILLLSPT